MGNTQNEFEKEFITFKRLNNNLFNSGITYDQDRSKRHLKYDMLDITSLVHIGQHLLGMEMFLSKQYTCDMETIRAAIKKADKLDSIIFKILYQND
tara:strand:- start:524 stop:811 length:288 start_codon:yes stop_codon:yes gene_type:complete